MMWVLIVSELLVFGAGLAAFLAVRLGDPAGFLAAQAQLHRSLAGVNTTVLVTSGYCAARAVETSRAGAARATRRWLAGAAALGLVFLVVKGHEFARLAAGGIGAETHAFFTFYFLLTGFHAAHVAFGIVILALVGWHARFPAVETGAAFW